MARRYSTAENTVRARIAERTSKKSAKADWSSAPRYWQENGEIYLCNNCTVSLLQELGVSLERIASCKRFDWRKASVETIEAFENMGGWLGDVLPPPAPQPAPAALQPAPAAPQPAGEPASEDNKLLLKMLAGMNQQMKANQEAIGQLYKMITE